MNKKWFWAGLVVVLALAWAIKNFFNEKEVKNSTATAQKGGGESYWTCPMHPNIHSDKPGECPICHMKLVQVKAQAAQANANAEKRTGRETVQATDQQTQLLGIQKHTVEKMNLRLLLPVSGRFISSSAVAFQVYESDLRYVKAGLTFRGESSFYPDEEIEGVVSSVDTIVDPSSRTVRVVGTLRKGPRTLVSESSFRGDVQVDLKDRIAIPESSVLHTGTEAIVYLFGDGNRLTARAVKLGAKTETFYEVLKGLDPGEVISSGPNFLIDSEAKIRGTPGGTDDQAHH